MFRQDNVSLVEFFEGGKSIYWPWRRHVVSCLVYSLGEHRGHEPHRIWWNTALWVKIKMLCCIVNHSATAVKPNQFCLWHLVSNAWMHTRIGCDGCTLPFSL